MITAAEADAASALLVAHWQAGTVLPCLPETIRPADRADGYAIQARLEKPGQPVLWGWKIAATSAAGQRHIGVDCPMAGRLLAFMVHPGGAELPLDGNRMRVAELEFAFRMGRDLPPRAVPYDQASILDAVAALHTAIEIPDSRYADFVTVGAPQLIADNACAHRFVLGPEAPAAWRDFDLAAHPVVARLSRGIERTGIGANVLGGPLIALTWLANELSAHAITLRAGQVVTTGTCIVPLEIAPGDALTGDFGALGQVTIRFATERNGIVGSRAVSLDPAANGK